MSKVHTPQEKKRLSYARDHYAKGKHDKGFRSAWPRKRVKASRAFRHELETLTRKGEQNWDVDLGGVKRKLLKKWNVRNLKQVVKQKIEKRQRRFGSKSARRLSNPQSAIRNHRTSRDALS